MRFHVGFRIIFVRFRTGDRLFLRKKERHSFENAHKLHKTIRVFVFFRGASNLQTPEAPLKMHSTHPKSILSPYISRNIDFEAFWCNSLLEKSLYTLRARYAILALFWEGMRLFFAYFLGQCAYFLGQWTYFLGQWTYFLGQCTFLLGLCDFLRKKHL